MQVSVSWINEWLKTPLTVETIASRLTMAGLEVEGFVPAGVTASHFVVGQIVQIQPHPQADKLRVCQVDIQAAALLQIVTAAENVSLHDKVALATVGAVLPSGKTIESASLRGVPSEGMFCSVEELGMATKGEGVYIFPAETVNGALISEVLNLHDQSLVLNITPNRGDCLSVRGLVREVIATTETTGKTWEFPIIQPTTAIDWTIDIQAPGACPAYYGRTMTGLNVAATTPHWMAEKLRRSGLRLVHPVVDVTNYVMLELGQPLHAFDLSSLQEAVTVRYAVEGEKLVLLDEKEVTLKANTLVIADSNGPIALAGVMGGARTSVSEQTTSIFLECAYFSPIEIAGKARQYGLTTDASMRFERGVDYAKTKEAIERATQLILMICGGEVGPRIDKVSDIHWPMPKSVMLRSARVTKVIGKIYDHAVIERILSHLGFSFIVTEGGWQVSVPSHRFDVSIEEDLIEEIARIDGYDCIAPIFPRVSVQRPLRLQEEHLTLTQLRHYFVSRDYVETIHYSFVDAALLSLLSDATPVALLNPISLDLSVMRTTLWAGLLKSVQSNLNRQQAALKLFEVGVCFTLKDSNQPLAQDNIVQKPYLAGVMTDAVHKGWRKKERMTYFDLKQEIEGIFLGLKLSDSLEFRSGIHAALHPGQSAEILLGGKSIGWLGALHPEIHKKLELTAEVFLFECALESLLVGQKPRFSELSKFPSVSRDLAFVMDREVSAAEVLRSAKNSAGAWCTEVTLFDVYQGDRLSETKKSLALSLTLQHPSRTLKEDEINQVIDSIIHQVKKEFNAILRDS
jgi:phenylalanyl-tRNA synthetase beta chain